MKVDSAGINNAGMTLVELLMCLVCLGILASIVIPQYAEYKKKAYDAMAISHIHKIRLAEESYYSEQHEYTYLCENLRNHGFTWNNDQVRINLMNPDDNSLDPFDNGHGVLSRWSWKGTFGHLRGSKCYVSSNEEGETTTYYSNYGPGGAMGNCEENGDGSCVARAW